jgi:hypothetical protein
MGRQFLELMEVKASSGLIAYMSTLAREHVYWRANDELHQKLVTGAISELR